MALSINAIEFTVTAAGGTGNKNIAHGLGTTPVLALFLSNDKTAGSNAGQHTKYMFGAATGASNQFVSLMTGKDALAGNTSTGSFQSGASACMLLMDDAGSFIMSAIFVSFDATNVVINVDNAPAADRKFVLITMAGISAHVGIDTVTTGAGAQSFTGVGFQGKAAIFSRATLVALSTGALRNEAILSIGAASASGARWAASWSSAHGISPSDANSRFDSTKALVVPTAAGAVAGAFDFTSFDGDGYTINKTTSMGSSVDIGHVIIGGNIQAFVGKDTQKASGGTKATTGVGFQPVGLLVFGTDATAENTLTVNLDATAGVAYGASNRSISAHDTDNVGTTETAVSSSATKVIQSIGGAAGAAVAEASLSTFDADGFTLNWSTADATARLFGFVAIGDVSTNAVGKGLTDSILLERRSLAA